MKAAPAASNQPELKALNHLIIADKVIVPIAALIAGTILCGWLMPGFGALLPQGWSLMKANTSLCILFCTICLALTRPQCGALARSAGPFFAAAVVIIGVVTLAQFCFGQNFGLDTLLAADKSTEMPGRMSIQSVFFFVVIGLSMMIDRTARGFRGRVLDALCVMLVMCSLVFIAGYIFGASKLIGQGLTTRISPQTLFCIGLLTLVQSARRAPYGFYSVLVGVGIGSRISRTLLPFVLVLPYVIRGAGEGLVKSGTLPPQYAAGLTASGISALLFFLVVMVGRRINTLERELRDMSLTDELTNIHNRRGFYLLGEQALLNAKRDARSVSILFLDVDGLKKVNDTLGHDVGSEMLVDIARLLRANFRNVDVVGRLGGDEFAVVTQVAHKELMHALRRMDEAIKIANTTGKPYQISFSKGSVTVKPKNGESLTDLVNLADAAMYQDKQQRRLRLASAG